MDDRAWAVLIDKIERDQCTPFLGAGASVPHTPSGTVVARTLAEKFSYPLLDKSNLPRVAQYVATAHGDADFARAQVVAAMQLLGTEDPDFDDEVQPHRILADFDLSLYITTNYDDYMAQALRHQGKDVVTRLSAWNYETRRATDEHVAELMREHPVVFHLHGHMNRQSSMVVTEDDYVDFIAETSATTEQPGPIPLGILEAMRTTTLLFIGYSMNDWNFRVLLRRIMRTQLKPGQRLNVSVQLRPEDDIEKGRQDDAASFLSDYLGTEHVSVYWGRADAFLAELKRRRQEAS